MPTLKVNQPMSSVLGKVSGSVMGAAQAIDARFSGDMARYGTMIGLGAAGLWGMSDPGDMGGVRGAVGAVGLGGAAFLGAGAWANKSGLGEKMLARGFEGYGPPSNSQVFANSYNKAWGGSSLRANAFMDGARAAKTAANEAGGGI